jgi:hypothetical protein
MRKCNPYGIGDYLTKETRTGLSIEEVPDPRGDELPQ